MPRLFITGREQALYQDIVKEYIKDIVGQFIWYYPISISKTKVHSVYDEAVTKVFENPIKVDAMVSEEEFEPQNNTFGVEYTVSLDVFLQARDLLDKGITPSEGDYFVYAGQVYEIASIIQMGDLYGQPEYVSGFKLAGKSSRTIQIDPETGLLPLTMTAGSVEANGELGTWQQQRGLQENIDGPTGDVRHTRKRLGDDMAEPALGEGPRTVSPEPDTQTPTEEQATSFYNE